MFMLWQYPKVTIRVEIQMCWLLWRWEGKALYKAHLKIINTCKSDGKFFFGVIAYKPQISLHLRFSLCCRYWLGIELVLSALLYVPRGMICSSSSRLTLWGTLLSALDNNRILQNAWKSKLGFTASIRDCGLTLSEVDIYNLSVITQATKPHVFIQVTRCIFIWKYWSSPYPPIHILVKEVTESLEGPKLHSKRMQDIIWQNLKYVQCKSKCDQRKQPLKLQK